MTITTIDFMKRKTVFIYKQIVYQQTEKFLSFAAYHFKVPLIEEKEDTSLQYYSENTLMLHE